MSLCWSHIPHCWKSHVMAHLSLLSTGSTQEDQSRHNAKIVDLDVKNQNKENKLGNQYKMHRLHTLFISSSSILQNIPELKTLVSPQNHLD